MIETPTQGTADVTGELPELTTLRTLLFPAFGSAAVSGELPEMSVSLAPAQGDVVVTGETPGQAIGWLAAQGDVAVTGETPAAVSGRSLIPTLQGDVAVTGETPLVSISPVVMLPDRNYLARTHGQLPGVTVLHSKYDSTRTLTGTSVATLMETVTIPGGIMGPNGRLLVEILLLLDAAASNTCWMRQYADGTTGSDIFMATGMTAGNDNYSNGRYLWNKGNTQAQIARNLYGANIYGTSSSGPVSYTIDTENDFDIDFRGQLNAADTARTLTLAWTAVTVFTS